MKPLLVGESNPYGVDSDYDHYPLYPLPEGSAGHRLCTKVMGLTRNIYLRAFNRTNLCVGKWNLKEARAEALRLTQYNYTGGRRTFVLLGAKVCSAFRAPFDPFTVKHGALWEGTMHNIVILPHPSGLSRAWNESGAFDKARAVLIEAGVLPVGLPLP